MARLLPGFGLHHVNLVEQETRRQAGVVAFSADEREATPYQYMLLLAILHGTSYMLRYAATRRVCEKE